MSTTAVEAGVDLDFNEPHTPAHEVSVQIHHEKYDEGKWVVWTKTGYWPPRKFHLSREAALLEAGRLAALFSPNARKFIVLKWDTKVSLNTVS